MEGGDPKYKREGELKKIDKLLNRKKEKFIANKYVEDILKNTTFAHTPTLYKIISQGKVGADAFIVFTKIENLEDFRIFLSVSAK